MDVEFMFVYKWANAKDGSSGCFYIDCRTKMKLLPRNGDEIRVCNQYNDVVFTARVLNVGFESYFYDMVASVRAEVLSGTSHAFTESDAKHNARKHYAALNVHPKWDVVGHAPEILK